MTFNCHYCPKVSKDLTTAIRHFEEKHRNKGEYIELEITESIVKPIKEDTNEN